MSSLDDFLVLKPKGSQSGGDGTATQADLDSPLKPTTVGLKLIDAPNNLSNGLAYRINGDTLERILVLEGDGDGDESSSNNTKVVATCSLSSSAVHLGASPDGRMVAVACIDGSLQCFDSTNSGMSLRWSIPNAHSHVSPNIYSTVSQDRSNGACGSGPILALDFSPNDYILLLVDATKGVALFDARLASPTNLISPKHSQAQDLLQNVSCASWRAGESESTSTMPFAIGRYDGSVSILEYSQDGELLKSVSDCGSPSEEDDFVCTHLNWSKETLVAGLCRVEPPEDNEEPDEDDEDDLAEHEACLFVTTINETLNRSDEWSEQGDVVPFFTVPLFGRHVFFTSVLCSQTKLVAVATNVGTDIGTVSPDGEGGWTPVEFQEGAAATTPTNEDDEYVFPLGICLVQLPSSSFRLILASTDGSISTFEYQHMNDPAFFSAPALGSTEDLPSDPLEITAADSTPDNSSWVVVDEKNNAETKPDSSVAFGGTSASKPAFSTTGKAPENNSAQSTPFSFGVSGSTTFGAAAKLSSPSPFGASPSAFGSGTSKGLTFGSPSSSGASPFAAFSKKPGAAPAPSIFGATSALGGTSAFGTASSSGTASTSSDTPAKPATGFGTFGGGATFGSATTPTGGGFAALSASSSKTTTGGFGSSSGAASAFGSGPSPFKMFASPSTPSSSGFPTKPLFGSATKSPAPSTDPKAPIESEIAKTPETKPQEEPPKPKETEETKEKSSDAPMSDTEKSAAKVFDQFDTENSGSLDVSIFEDLSEGLGEGFYGDEYDAQISLVDPSKSGKITRENFIKWYKGLVEGSGDDDESLDTAEQEEREEERQNAKEAFGPLSKTEGGKSYIAIDDFGKVIEAMGSTYCEEEHRRTIKKLKKDDRIYESDFLEWYIDWLFGDGDSDDDSDDDDSSGGGSDTGAKEGEGNTESLASIFKVDESSWKCDVCSVRNKDSVNRCVSCDSPRPGFEGSDAALGGAAPTLSGSSSIGAGGFSFGGTSTASSSIGAGGFTFGASKSDAATASSSIGAGGFSFGGASTVTPDAAKAKPVTSSSIGAGGFSFGGASTAKTDAAKAESDTATASSSIGSGGFSFGGPSTAKPDVPKAKPDAPVSSTSIGTGGFSFGGSTAKDTSGGSSAEKVPDVPKNNNQELSDTEKAAAKVFDQFDTEKAGSLDVSTFEDLSEGLGEGFHGDEYDAQVALVDPSKSGKITRDNFIKWYKSLVEGSGDSDNASLDTAELEEREEERQNAREAFGTLSKKTEEGKSYIEIDDFGKVIEAMGSTYCEEEHKKTIKKLKKDDEHIYESDFLEWYIDWLFGDEDSDDDSDDDSTSGDSDTGDKAEANTESLASIFKVDESSWKCDVCSVRNKDSANRCVSCDSPRPGFEGSDAALGGVPPKLSALSSSSSIGAGGFSFGGSTAKPDTATSSSSIGAGGFSFGGSTAKPGATKSSSIGAGGFSFGGSTAKPDAATSSSSIGAGGFSFGGSKAKPDATKSSSTGAGGFSFGGSTAKPNSAPSSSSFGVSTAKPDATKSSSIGAGGFSFGGSTAKPDTVPSSSTGSGGLSFGAKSGAKTSSESTSSSTKPSAAKPGASASTSAAFPPMSKKAPTNPFGAKPAAKAPAFPPMSKKAPTNPFGAKPAAKPAAKPSATTSSGNAAFPPMSAKAPTNPFGAKPAAKPSTSTSGNAAFPPMSAKAPTNPFGAKPAAKPSATSSGNAAFPPMSAKAPTNPFGAKTSTKAASSNANATFSSPSPFGAKTSLNSPFAAFSTKTTEQSTLKSPFAAFSAKPAGVSSSSSPFSAIGKKTAENAPLFGAKPSTKAPASTANAAFPPISKKAPSTPFGAKSPTKAASSSANAAFPPMPAKAPSSPFGTKTPAKAAASSANAAFPPLSKKAPTNPFGAKSPSKAPTSSANAAFPPMSAKAPTNPFGAKSPAKAPTSSANPAFPPMSNRAPSNPFGSKTPAKAAVSSTNAAFPPMSAKTPSNPFGAKSPTKAPGSNANTAFPSMSTKASSNLFGSKPASKVSASSAKVTSPHASSRFGSSQNVKSQALGAKKKKTELQVQLDSVISSFSSTLAKVSKMRANICVGDREIRGEIEAFAVQTENERSKLLNLDNSLRENRADTAFLLSRKTDASRQVDAAKTIVQEIKFSNAEGKQSVAGSQALDQESETKRRKFAAYSRRIVRKKKLAMERAELLEEAIHGPADSRHRFLLQGVMNFYKRSMAFEEASSRIANNIDRASKTVPYHARTKRSMGRSTYGLESSLLTPSRRHNKLRPTRIGSGKQDLVKRQTVRSKSSASYWKGIESSLEQIGNASVKVDRFNTLSAGETKTEVSRPRSNVGERRIVSHSLLMSPSAKPMSNAVHEQALTVSTKINIFSPPSKAKVRSGWDKPSTIDMDRVNQLAINAPQDLKQTTLSNASRETLANFGTTPEKLRAAVDIKKNEVASIPASLGSTKPKDAQTKRSTGAAAAFPPLSSKAPSNPFSTANKRETLKPVSSEKKPTQKSTSSSAPLPPMPKQAPKNPFAKAPTSKPPSGQVQTKPAAAQKTSPFGNSAKATSKDSSSASTTFGNMKGLGDSLFSSGSAQKDSQPKASFGATPATSSSQTGMGKDYKAILTSFYEKYKKEKLPDVDKTIAKYKGREQELFQKLSQKYKVPNPLQESSGQSTSGSTPAGFSSSSGFGNLGSTSSQSTMTTSSGFGNSGSKMGASPFGSSTGASTPQKAAASSSPFGKAAPSSTPFGSSAGGNTASKSGMFGTSAQSPFGKSNSQTTATSFGSSPAPAPSPFGNTASSSTTSTPFGSTGGLSSASPFGGSAAQTPFGAPSPSPMQPNSQRLYNGKTARDLLLQFYKEKNPSKVSDVDKLLAKYNGREDHMFRNLAKKYNLDPSVFGVSAGAPAPSPGFGSPSATPAFGQASAMGTGTSPFGQSSGGFGQPSTFGGGPKPSGTTFGSGMTSSFGSSGFGSLAQSSPSPFGGGQSSGFGAPAAAFGSVSSPFGAPRR